MTTVSMNTSPSIMPERISFFISGLTRNALVGLRDGAIHADRSPERRQPGGDTRRDRDRSLLRLFSGRGLRLRRTGLSCSAWTISCADAADGLSSRRETVKTAAAAKRSTNKIRIFFSAKAYFSCSDLRCFVFLLFRLLFTGFGNLAVKERRQHDEHVCLDQRMQ